MQSRRSTHASPRGAEASASRYAGRRGQRILILGLNYAPEIVGVGVYTAGLAEALAAEGHAVRVIAGQPYYPGWRVQAAYRWRGFTQRVENGVRVLRVPHYIPVQQSGGRRVAQHTSFALAALLPALLAGIAFRPDLVLTVAPSTIAAPVARFAALLAGAQSWLHVQDLEVETAFATKLLPSRGWVGRLALWFEVAVLRSFSRVSAISPEMCRRLVAKGVPRQRVVEFRNWTDTGSVRPLAGTSPYRAEWGIETAHVALYAGNIANKQGIDIVLEAARRLAKRQDLTFVICGEGPNRRPLEARAAGLANVRFFDLQPRERLNELMGLATIHLLPQIAGASDLVLPSKLTNMLASGRPVVATAPSRSGLAREVTGCGVVVEPGDADAFAAAIVGLMEDKAAWSAAATAARERAEERWSKEVVLGRFMEEVARLGEGGKVDPPSAGGMELE